MYGVEHYYPSDNSSTYELFETLMEAEKFCLKQNWTKDNYPIFIFQAKFNRERIFLDDGQWNYDDFGDSILEYMDYYKKVKYVF